MRKECVTISPSAHDSIFPSSFRIRSLLLVLAIIGVISASWAKGFWNSLDSAVFWNCNTRLSEPGFWQNLWAVTNWRPFDLVGAILIGLLFLTWVRENHQTAQRRLADGIAFGLLVLIVKMIEDRVAVHIGYFRLSPTNWPGALKLSELVQWIKPKDTSAHSFPGDHACILFAAVGFFWRAGGFKRGLVALCLLLPLAIPRIVIGAHWVTDVFVGGTNMALAIMILAFTTPAAFLLSKLLQKRANKLLAIAVKIARTFRLLPRLVSSGSD